MSDDSAKPIASAARATSKIPESQIPRFSPTNPQLNSATMAMMTTQRSKFSCINKRALEGDVCSAASKKRQEAQTAYVIANYTSTERWMNMVELHELLNFEQFVTDIALTVSGVMHFKQADAVLRHAVSCMVVAVLKWW